MNSGLDIYFWFASIGTVVFLVWLIYISPRVHGKGSVRNRAVAVGIGFLCVLIAPDIWALTRLDGISWFVAWVMGMLFFHIIELGIWHRICWGDKCPECGAWVETFDEPVPDNLSALRRTHTCPKCGWTDSWAIVVKKSGKNKERS
jgi:hypothetical protein